MTAVRLFIVVALGTCHERFGLGLEHFEAACRPPTSARAVIELYGALPRHMLSKTAVDKAARMRERTAFPSRMRGRMKLHGGCTFSVFLVIKAVEVLMTP